jgi:hypothetical protein
VSDQRIILEFVGDATGLKPAVESLKVIAGLSQEQIASFDKANNAFKARTVEITKQTAATEQLTTAVKGTGTTVEELANKTKKVAPEVQKAKESLLAFNAGVKQSVVDTQNLGGKWQVIPKAVDEAAKKSKGLKGTISELATSAKGLALTFGIAFGVQQVVAFGKEAINLSAKAEGVERAFTRVGSPQILDGLRQATRGTVTDLVLMQNAVKASNFKIPLDELANLFKFAQSRARETGESVDYLVDSIILGIGRKSPLILDNLGISAISLREKFNGLSAEAATVGDVAKAVGEIATEELAKIGVQADTTADAIAQLSTSFVNWQTRAGDALVALGIGAAYALGLIDKSDERVALAAQNAAKFLVQINEAKRKGLIDEAGLVQRELTIRDTINATQKNRENIEARLLEISKQRRSISNAGEIAKETAELNRQLYAADGILIFEYKKLEVLKQLRAARMRERESETTSANAIKNVAYYTDKLEELDKQQKEVNTTLERNTQINIERKELQKELDKLLGKEIEQLASKAPANSIAALTEELAALKTALERTNMGTADFLINNEKVKAKAAELAAAWARLTEEVAKFSVDPVVVEVGTQSFVDPDAALAEIERLNKIQQIAAINTEANATGLAKKLESIDVALTLDKIALAESLAQSTVDLELELALKIKAIRDGDFKDYLDFIAKKEKAAEEAAATEIDNKEKVNNYTVQLLQAGLSSAANIASSIASIQQQAVAYELQLLQQKYDEGQISREEFEQGERKLQRESAQRAKDAATFQAIIGAAQAVISALSSPGVPFPVALAFSLFAGAAAAVQVVAIQSAPLPQFAKGTKKAPAGYKWVGEEGAELIFDGGGYPIITHRESNILASNPTGMAADAIRAKYEIPKMHDGIRSLQLKKEHTTSAIARGSGIDYRLLADTLAERLQFPDRNIVKAIDRQRTSERAGLEYLAGVVEKANRFKARGTW